MAYRTHALVAALAAVLPGTVAAQTVIVGPGQTLTRADLDAGMFNGQPFVLGPGATFEIAGGALEVRSDDEKLPFDMRSSTIVATDSGRVDASVLENVALIIDGGIGITADIVSSTCVLTSGSIAELRANTTTFLMTGGWADELWFNELLLDQSGSTVQINGGTIDRIKCRNRAQVTINGGAIDDFGTTEFTSSIVVNGGSIEEITVFGVLFPQPGQSAERPELFMMGGSIGSLGMIEFERFVMAGGEIAERILFSGDISSRPRASTVELLGGAIHDEVEAFGSLALAIDGTDITGTVRYVDLPELASVVVRSGSLSGAFLSTDAPTLIAGGTIEGIISARGLLLSITGGDIRNGFRGAVLTTVSGGAIDGPIDVDNSTTLVLNAESAAIDGAPLPLVSGQPFEVSERNGATLTAILADGSPFQVDLNDERMFPNDFVSPNVRLVVLKGDRPCLPDINLDGAVNQSDLNLLVDAFLIGAPACDQNGDGVCTPADFNAWIFSFNAGC